ncbi:MOSC domain-containing protein [Lentzea tibetensis]|uniref:MOSC domain-containing protein n=1 Tax=Lentzea tibetensis TaxID=2591470 RepID=A0A563ESY6_9PSEU|nr:MOSC domain-containing protein [Lentzea tibetensis]TWP50763.1 MOSC domain-containing protein [Lentzea tibetensis]
MGSLLSVNVGVFRPLSATSTGRTGIDKRPVDGPVALAAPEAGLSGVAGDSIGEPEVHGGPDKAVYAYAREDLDFWDPSFGNGVFGENLTTSGVDVNGAEIGERWGIGSAVLEVCAPRTPCRTFAAWLGREKWVKTFTDAGRTGAYLRVITPGSVSTGDEVRVLSRPGHGMSVADVFSAMMKQPEMLPRLLELDALAGDLRGFVAARLKGR